jgi:predicted nucleic-acid-binding protein
VIAHLDTSVLVRHLTGDPPAQARAAGALLDAASDLILEDVVIAELVYVLESVYAVPRERVAELVRAVVEFRSIRVEDPMVIHGALRHYVAARVDFADAYVAAAASASGTGTVASFDRDLDRIPSITRVVP